MLKKVASKAHNALQVTDQLATVRPLKLLNYISSMVGNKNAKLDATAVADPDAGYQNGYTLLFPDMDKYIISKTLFDYYRDEIIRVNLELLLCNNTVTVSRQMPIINNQGGVNGSVNTVIYDNLACKILPLTSDKDKVDDVFLNNYAIYIPILNPVEINDKLQFEHTYNVAKANGVRQVTEGIIEVVFNRDTRW
jgi:hypothetical protein